METRGKRILRIILIVFMCIFMALTFAFSITGIIYGARSNISNYPLDNAIEQKLIADVKPNNADVRIMSSNLLVHYKSWGGKPVKPRANLYLSLLNHYSPDVIGLQELSEEWYAAILKNKNPKYKMLKPFETGVNIRLTAMIYNSETLTLIDNGDFKYKEKDNPRLRRVNWAIFKDKNDKIFGVTNTHLSLLFKGKEEEYKGVMDSQANELINFVDKLSKDYSCPVFSLGDFNATEDKLNTMPEDNPAIYEKLTKSLFDTKYLANNKLSGPVSNYESPSYDHIFVNKKNVTLDSFHILSYEYLKPLSDHFPIYLDFSL